MPVSGTETLRYKDELDQVQERIGGLLQQLESEEDPRAKQRLQKKVTRRVSRLVNLEPETEAQPAETFHDVREKLEDLLGQLHLEERQNVLSQVVEWFVGHTPAAQKDIAVLERADKECLRRECERAWSALGTEDRMRKKERNTVRQVQQFVESVAIEHERRGEQDSEEEDLVEFDQRLLKLSDERLTIELATLRKEIANKEKDVMQIMLNIAERGSFLTGSSIESIRHEIEKQDGSSDLVAEQEKLWVLAEDELRQLEAHKDMIFETIGFVKGRMKGEDGKVPLTDEMSHFLKKKRQEVETKHGPGLLAKRMEDHGKELEAPSSETLLRLQNETAELNQRIQQAAALNLKVTSESQLNVDFDKALAALKTPRAPPDLETLQQLADIMDPQKDWQVDNGADEDQRRVQIETERLMKKKADLLQIITRMTSEQQALQREWAEQWTSFKALEAKLQKQEEQIPAQEENLRVIQEQHELVAASLACARSNISAAATLKPPRSIASHPRLPSLNNPSSAVKPTRTSEDGDNASASSGSFTRQLSGVPSHGSMERGVSAASASLRQRRTLLVDPGNPVPTWSADAVVADGVGELLNAQGRGNIEAEWVEVFHEDSVGRIRKSALVAQAALFSQLGKEQDDLKLEVEELERQVQDRVKMTKITTDGKAEEVARAAVQDMERQIKGLESIQSCLAGIESLGTQDINRRMAYLERCSCEYPEQLPPFLQPMREAVLQEWGNCDLLRQINNLGPETEKFRAQFASFKKACEPRHRRRLSMMQKKEKDIRKRNRKMRQACRELRVFREQVRIAREEASLLAEK